jgi:DNA-directed RNA polymerase subunit M/transcription elongation factor TFIIS
MQLLWYMTENYPDLHTVRDRIVRRLAACLDGNKALARRICSNVYNWTITTATKDNMPKFWDNRDFRFRMTSKAMSMELNIRNTPHIKEKLLDGSITPTRLVTMTPYEMHPEMYEPIFERIAKKHLKCMATSHDDAPDGVFTCRCGSKKTVYYSMQTRSADEPMTVFVSCLKCRKNWKTS